MDIYYLCIEAIPNPDNPESKQCRGAYVNFWIKASAPEEALSLAKEYIEEENWSYINTEEITMANRSTISDPDALECYDDACEYGLSAAFYCWENDNNG